MAVIFSPDSEWPKENSEAKIKEAIVQRMKDIGVLKDGEGREGPFMKIFVFT